MGYFKLIKLDRNLSMGNNNDNNSLNNGSDDLEFVSLDELLDTIDELEGKASVKRESDYETVLSDNQESEEIHNSDFSFKHTKIKRVSKEKKNYESRSLISNIFSWCKVIVVAVVIALLLNKFVLCNAVIPSGSMESTIMTGDRVIGLRISYLFSDPDRGDIVIFKYPDDESKLYIKRIIGVPGDKVEIKDGLVYINDSEVALEEDYLSVTPKGDFGPYEVPDESYFMLGDNRNVSKDSRYWENTFVAEDKIIARAYLRYYPSLGVIK